MSRMIDLIRASALPSNVMQSASKGSLSLPAPEMIAILVYLAVNNPIFGQQAQLTLAGWDEASSRTAASDPSTPKEVLNYFISPANLRPVLLPALLANPSVSTESLIELAPQAGRDVVELMLKNQRIIGSPQILHALSSNPHLTGIQGETVRNLIHPEAAQPEPPAQEENVVPVFLAEPATPDETGGLDEVFHLSPAGEAQEADGVLDDGVLAYLSEHASEIAAEAHTTFQPIGGIYEEFMPEAEEAPVEQATVSQDSTGESSTAAGAGAAVKKAPKKAGGSERGSALQKISKLDIKGRIQLAMKGSKEERSLLIRDGTKDLWRWQCWNRPQVSDGEVERFAGQKNVLEAVLRGIPNEAPLCQELFRSISRALKFQPANPARPVPGADEKHSGRRPAQPLEQQGSFGHGSQAGHQDVQTEDGNQQRQAREHSATGANPGIPRVTIPCMASLPESDPIADLLKRSRTIAVVGLSNNPLRPSHGVSAYMQSHGYRIIPVNPVIAGLAGRKVACVAAGCSGEDRHRQYFPPARARGKRRRSGDPVKGAGDLDAGRCGR